MSTKNTNNGAGGGLASEYHYLVGEISASWRWSEKTIRAIFLDEPGVILLDRAETCHKRGYRTMSIPASVVERVHQRLEIRQKGIRGPRP